MRHFSDIKQENYQTILSKHCSNFIILYKDVEINKVLAGKKNAVV